jgi:hypothetical protein
MMKRASRWAPLFLIAASSAFGISQNGEPDKSKPDVFVVGEHSATAGIATDFTPTHLQLPEGRLSERGRRELIRDLEAEQGFAHRVLPMGTGLLLEANGELTPRAAEYKKMIYEKGASVSVGDRVVVTALAFKPDRIVIDVNGGPYAKHRYLSHVSFGDAPVAHRGDDPSGARVTLIFKDGVPEISAPEVKALLTPVIDFGAKTSTDAYADSLPAPLKESISAHEVLVGMDRRMVLASVGAPESKVREHAEDTPEGVHYEEWIYGHVPQTVRFVRFKGDRVILVKVAALGKPIEIHDKNEMGGSDPEPDKRDIALGDGIDPNHPMAPPTLRQAGEKDATLPANSAHRVQYPPPAKPTPAPDPAQQPPSPQAPPVQ